MEKVLRVFYSKESDSLDIWFDDPEKEKLAREIDDGVIAKLDSKGKVIGIEIISLATLAKKPIAIPVKA